MNMQLMQPTEASVNHWHLLVPDRAVMDFTFEKCTKMVGLEELNVLGGYAGGCWKRRATKIQRIHGLRP